MDSLSRPIASPQTALAQQVSGGRAGAGWLAGCLQKEDEEMKRRGRAPSLGSPSREWESVTRWKSAKQCEAKV